MRLIVVWYKYEIVIIIVYEIVITIVSIYKSFSHKEWIKRKEWKKKDNFNDYLILKYK